MPISSTVSDASTVTLDQALQMAEQACAQGQSDTALVILTEILKVDPDQPSALAMLGVLAHQAGQNDNALLLLQKAVALRPDAPILRVNLAVVHRALKQDEQAIEQYHQALQLDPDQTVALNNLGNLLRERCDYRQAAELFARAVELDPELSQAIHNLGICHAALGQPENAIGLYHQALAIHPGDLTIRCSLANAYMLTGRLDLAQSTYRRIIADSPGHQAAYWGLAITLLKDERLDEAEQAMRVAAELESQNRASPLADLAAILRDQGRIEEAVATLRQALVLNPQEPMPMEHLAAALNYDPCASSSATFHAHRQWAALLIAKSSPTAIPFHDWPNDRQPDRTIRLGYLSPDFRGHPVACFMLPIWENHDPAKVEVYAYAQVARPDHVTERCRKLFAHRWRSVLGMSDAQAAEQIRTDRIDILIDLAGHTADNRLDILALKPAPIQMTYMGYPHTTGLHQVDYRLTDAVADPPSRPTPHVERLLRLTPGQSAYRPLSELPQVNELPALTQGYVTFGSLNNLAKINSTLLKSWGQILLAVPDSRLLIVRGGLSGQVCEQLKRPLIEMGISPDRLMFQDNRRHPSAFAQAYHRIDIALDPQPYSGCTSTCEALWMGLPVVTLLGQSHAGRLSASVLTQAGLKAWITTSWQDYVALAVSLASDLPTLAGWRAALRPQLQASALCDVVAVTRSLESLGRQAWRTYCQNS